MYYYPENYELLVVSWGFIVGFAFSPWVSVCVFDSRTHAGVSIYLTHAWVRETNTHTETQ